MNTTLLVIAAVVLGLLAWRRFGSSSVPTITAAGYEELRQQHPNLQILDVRTPAEVAKGKIKGAKVANVMSSDFQSQIAKLDKSKPYLVYCRSGNRSLNACRIMQQAGFEQVYNLSGGYGSWSRR
jgi:rhodanese-related sulfurtransferase